MLRTLVAAALLTQAPTLAGAKDLVHSFHKVTVTQEFWAEGADFGDFNHDGKIDVVAGPFWYEGPDFKQRHEYWPATASFKCQRSDGTVETLAGFEGALGTNNAYSECFLNYTYDFNGDGWDDVIIYGFPGKEAVWYENPKGRSGHWTKHVILNELGSESPGFGDVTGDGKPEIICCAGGFLGYATADWSNPAGPWKFHAVTPKGSYQRFTHGVGYGDVNGDGRIDLLDKDGWWEQPASTANDPLWTHHPVRFGAGGAQMVVYDVNGDGLNDVITANDAHHYGLLWFEQVRENGASSFREHVILNKNAAKNRYGVQFSQPHALFLMDMDGDGLKDLVAGKRFWAHGKFGPDPESDGSPAVLYWFKLTRPAKGQAEFIPNLVDDDSGVGTQVMAGTCSNKQFPDIVVGNKKGVFVFEHLTK